MKSTLLFTKKNLPGTLPGKASRFPAMRDPIKSTIESRLGEEDGLFINYGMFNDSLPYSMQDDYDLAEEEDLSLDCAVLENRFLRAEFMLSLGGRLWKLYDKIQQRDLVTDNTRLIPCNLAICNAWFAGGVEFNCGRRGHDANTCRSRFAAELSDPELGKVLRIYDYSVDRKVPYQMDFFLPEDSRFLLLRGRISNPSDQVIPMYWWSNIAVDMTPGCRVVVPAQETYLNKYDAGSHFISKIPMPDGEGFDQTYPESFKIVRDHFYNIPENSRKYEALFNRDGSGFLHLSTRRLQGRKLFVWGKTTGGDNWQKKLLGENVCDYLELQAGLAKTQQESLPMPPKCAWEWLEAYGGINADPQDIFGSWDHAVETVTSLADTLLPEEKMDQILAETKERIALQPGTLRYSGSGRAALEELRSGKKLAPQLDFGTITDCEEEWAELIRNRTLDDTMPRCFQADADYLELLKSAPDVWKKHYFLALWYFRAKDWERAEDHGKKALQMNRNAWTLQAYANILLCSVPEKTSCDEALAYLEEAALTPDADAYLIKETMKLLNLHEHYQQILSLYSKLSLRDQQRPTVQMLLASALLHTGKPFEAREILLQNGGLDLPDAREGDILLTNLFLEVCRACGMKEEEITVPLCMDYRTK